MAKKKTKRALDIRAISLLKKVMAEPRMANSVRVATAIQREREAHLADR
jgi:hypothetical protein